MPKKSRRHSTAPDAYWFVEEDTRERCDIGMLWLHVIDQVWRDCHNLQNRDTYKRRDAEDALVWVIKNDKDFHAVCGLADINPKDFRSAVIRSIKNRYPRIVLNQVIAEHFFQGQKLYEERKPENFEGYERKQKEKIMPLNFINENAGGAFVRYSVEDNEWSRSSATGDLVEFDPSSGVAMDIEKIQLGWLKLSGGRDWVPWPKNDPQKCPKPSDAHKQGFSVKLYSTKLFEDEPVRELCTSQTGMNMFIRKVYDECEASGNFGKGKLPAIKIYKSKEKQKIGNGSTRVPPFEITKWIERPIALADENEESADGEPAPEVEVPRTVSRGASDDVSFDDDEI